MLFARSRDDIGLRSEQDAVGLHFAIAAPQIHLQNTYANRVPKTLRVCNVEKPVQKGYP